MNCNSLPILVVRVYIFQSHVDIKGNIQLLDLHRLCYNTLFYIIALFSMITYFLSCKNIVGS